MTREAVRMPEKKRKAGRPRLPEPKRSLIAVKGTGEFETWLDGLVDQTDLGTRTLLMRHALKCLAEKVGYSPPMPKR